MSEHYELIKLCMIGTFCLIGIFSVLMSLFYARRTWKINKESDERLKKMMEDAMARQTGKKRKEDPKNKQEDDSSMFKTTTCRIIYNNPDQDPKIDDLFKTIDEAFSAQSETFSKFDKAFSKMTSVVSEKRKEV